MKYVFFVNVSPATAGRTLRGGQKLMELHPFVFCSSVWLGEGVRPSDPGPALWHPPSAGSHSN